VFKLTLNKILNLVFFLLLFQQSSFSDSNTLTLDKVVKSVLNNHPNLLAAKTQLDAAKASQKIADGGFDPVIKFNSYDFIEGNYQNSGYLDATIEQPTTLYGTRFIAGYRRSKDGLPPYYDQEITQNDGEVRAGIEVPILRDGSIDRRRANLSIAAIEQELSSATVSQRKIELIRAAKNAYFDWLAAGSRVRVIKNLLEVTEERQHQLQERQLKGDLAKFDVTDNQRSVLQRRSQLVSAERALAQAKFELSVFLRDEAGQPITVSDDKLPPSFPALSYALPSSYQMKLEYALSNRPDLMRINQLLKQNSVELELADNQILPKLDAQILASQDLGASVPKYDETEIRTGIKFELPLFNRSATGKSDSLKAKQAELEFLSKFLTDRISADLKDVFAGIKLASERIKISEQEYKNAKEVEEGERERFFHGDSNLIFVNLREQTTADAAIRVIDANLEYQKALAALEAITAENA
jgi:cobalt-zinc-cadmium efflux system outer membrane protein